MDWRIDKLAKVGQTIVCLLLIYCCCPCFGQQTTLTAWFVDGYHGGVYGHYPKQWYTGFICDKLEENPDWKICLEIEPETWDSIAVIAPDDLEHLRGFVKAKRVEFTNPTWAQPYLWNVSGESIMRQFEEGMRTIKKYFPEAEITTYAAEEPCLTSCLPAVLKEFGMKYAVLRCPDTCWGGYPAAYGGELVNMVGPDGTTITAVPRPECEELQRGSTWQTASWRNNPAYLAACQRAGIEHPVGMCYQDAGWKNGPWLGSDATSQTRRNVWRNIYTTWTEYIEDVSIRTTDDDWHFTQEDIKPCLMWGSSVLNNIARKVRWAENGLIQKEKMDVIDAFKSEDAPEAPWQVISEMREAWHKLSLAQHHDTWIVPYNGLKSRRMTWADWVDVWTREASDTPLPTVRQGDDAEFADEQSASGSYRIYNTTGHARKEIVRAGGYTFLAEIPAFGYRDFTLDDIKAGGTASESCRVVEQNKHHLTISNGCCVVTFDLDRGGVVTSLKTLVSGKWEEFVHVADKSSGNTSFGELRGFFYKKDRWCSSTEDGVKCIVKGDNSPHIVVSMTGKIGGSPFEVTYQLRSGSPLIDCSLCIDWKGNPGIGEYEQSAKNWKEPRRAFCDDRYKLSVLFPVRLENARLWKDAPFDVCESRQDSTWYSAWTDIQHNVILHWVDIYDATADSGIALFTDHTGSYSFGKNFPLALTAQYSGVGLWGRDYKIDSPLEMRYALVPHKGQWDKAGIAQLSTAWNEPLKVVTIEGEKSGRVSLVDLGDAQYELTSARRTEDGVELRLFNAEDDDSEHEVRFGSHSFKVSIPRFGIKTIQLKSF